jgi:NAD(P)-dependent dehydrogenase (short-subunit alcohol dehydrogenase family)
VSGFEGKVVIVTGAAQGIGAAYAEALATSGAAVVVADLNEDGAKRVVGQINAAGGISAFVPVDVASPDSAQELARRTVEEFGGIDGLVNNAAIYGTMKFDLLISVDWDYYKQILDVNLSGALNMTRAVYRAMRKRGGGSIVNQSSTAAYLYSGFYGLAKAGLNSLTQQLAHELGGMNIRVNAIAPGPVDTQATRIQAGDAAQDLVKSMAIKRLGQPSDLVGAMLFLLSDESRWITGQIIAVDGGQTFRP